ncbi:DNRLRE domain-containing protein [Crossiella sp. CA198]|uniref:DNRLRE domain-containing protein n=1 Tax=Crossiella sp. CA198 TaxID=3455607 RepID=UPI003F8D2A7F
MSVRRVAVVLALVSALVPVGSAQAQQQPVELVDARTEYSSTFANPDGSRTLMLHTGPVHVRDGSGWRPVDLTLRMVASGRIEPVAHPRALSLGGAGSTELARMMDGAARVSRQWPTPLPAPVLAGNRATYPEARPGRDLVVTVTRNGFAQRLVPSGGGVGVPMAGNGVDWSSGSDLVAEPVSVSLGPVLDTYVQSNILTAPMGDQPDVRVGTFDGAIVARSFLGWQLAGLRGKQVRRAELELWNWHSWSCQPRGWQVWETGVADGKTAWSLQPAWLRQVAGSTKTLGYSANCPDSTVGVELTGLVREWAGGGAVLGGLGLRAADEGDVFAWKKWSASEGAEGHPPRLEVTYQEG